MENRDQNGHFVVGNKASPGRPRRKIEHQYLDITLEAVKPSDWRAIMTRAVADAKKGDFRARQFVADYAVGKPPEILNLRGNEALRFRELLDGLTARGFGILDVIEALRSALIEDEFGEDDDE